VTIEEAFDELEKHVGASDHKTDLPNMLHLGSLPQTAGWIDWLQLVRLSHGMMVCTPSVAVMCLKLGVEDDGGQVILHSVNNTVIQLSDMFLLNHDEEDPIVRMVSIKYAVDDLVDCNGNNKWCRRMKSSCNLPSQECCLFSYSSDIECFFMMSFVSTTILKGALEPFCL